jgi:hypothetical protein
VRDNKQESPVKQRNFERWFCESDEVMFVLSGGYVVRTPAVDLEDLVLLVIIRRSSKTTNKKLPAMQSAQHRGGPQASI